MTVHIKNQQAIEKMRISGRLAAEVLAIIEPHVVAGVTTGELNEICHKHITEKQGCIPAPLNYRGSQNQPPFPASICTSVNHVVCHGIPNEQKKLKNGDIINIDVTVIKDGYHGDTSKMYFVGKASVLARRLVDVTQECLYIGIEQVKPGARLGDIGYVIQKHAHKNRFTVVQELCGHGIGLGFHEPPQVLHYGELGTGMALKAGMIFTIEPMINAGNRHIKPLADAWTIVTRDHKLSAQWEHTILVTETGYEVLTRRPEEEAQFGPCL